MSIWNMDIRHWTRRSTSYDAVQLVLIFVLLPPQSQQMHDLLLRRAALLQLLETLAVDLSPRQVLQQPLQRHRGETQWGERLVDGLLTQCDVWSWTGRQKDSAIRNFATEKEKKRFIGRSNSFPVPSSNTGQSLLLVQIIKKMITVPNTNWLLNFELGQCSGWCCG